MPLMPIKCRICYRSIGAECDEDGNLFTDLCPDCEEHVHGQEEWR